ncbi:MULTISPECIES: autotransporter outer membrane beta-barrel domain-containing protein [unclassified Stenotrophomonas]|uniref:autotransporter outer membrane beta-barrel domain-containing protein n=1 Tax=unclassified Stenotrophomonas TaxID=196198 RepID=UPI00211964B4|nr:MULTISPECIES: autotransporter outer membrane beta-barrel domain-containing protein [unclassified Stenotrophomonas]
MTSAVSRAPQRLHLLALAISASLACSASAAWAQSAGPIIADGTQQVAAPGAYATTDDAAAGYVFHALNAGSIRADGPVTISATGSNTAGLRAESDGTVTLTGGTLTTGGDYSAGLSIATGGRIELLSDATGQGVTLSTGGVRSHAAQVDGGTLLLRDAMLDTSGRVANGIAASNGAVAEVSGGSIHTTGDQSHAVSASNATVTLRDTVIGTTSHNAHGLFAENGGRIDGDGLAITTYGNGSTGATVYTGATLTLSNSTIETGADFAKGVTGGGTVTLIDTHIRVAGNASGAVELSSGTLRIEGGVLQADDERGSGVFLWNDNQVDIIGTQIDVGHYGLNINGRGNEVRLTDVDIHTTDYVGTGIWLPGASSLSMRGGSIITETDQGVAIDNRAGAVTLEGVRVSTAGASAHGLYASMDTGGARPTFQAERVDVRTTGFGGIGAVARLGGTIGLRDSVIATTGDKGYGVLSGGAGEMTLSNTHVSTTGLDAAAAVVNANGSLDIDGGSLTSAQAATFWVRAARHVAARNGARLIGGSGTLMHVDAAFAGPFDVTLDQDVYARGDIVITPDDIAAGVPVVADIRVKLNGRSHWQGASSVVNQVSLSNDSRWTLTGDSSVRQLDLRDSTLALSTAGATRFNRLTVEGDFIADNALLVFNGALGADDSLTDTLHVRGDTRGTASVQVNNVRGLGGQTVNGIQLIQVDGASDAVYRLNGRAVAGQYDYFLHKGGVNTPGDGGWYLRSELAPTPPDPCDADPDGPGCVAPPDPCDSDPTGPGCGVVPPDPCATDRDGPGCVLPPDPCEVDNEDSCDRPRPPQILRPEAGAYLANQAAAVSMFQHRLHDREGAYAPGDARDAGWLRVTSTQTRQDMAGQLALKGRASTVMSGLDMLHWGGTRQGRAGVLLAAGQASTDVRSHLSGYSATGTVKGAALGIYATWMQRPDVEEGAYLDSWLQHGRYRTTVQGIGLGKERQDARTHAASLEAGYAWKLRLRDSAMLLVQPQLQLTYADYRAERLVEHNGTQVATGAAGGLSSRLGVRVMGDVRNEDRRVQPFVSAHWLRDSSRNSVWMDDTRIEGAVPKNRYELRGGAMLQLGTRWSAWADLGLQRGDNAYRSVSAQMGLKARW